MLPYRTARPPSLGVRVVLHGADAAVLSVQSRGTRACSRWRTLSVRTPPGIANGSFAFSLALPAAGYPTRPATRQQVSVVRMNVLMKAGRHGSAHQRAGYRGTVHVLNVVLGGFGATFAGQKSVARNAINILQGEVSARLARAIAECTARC